MQEALLIIVIMVLIIGAPYVLGPWLLAHVPFWVIMSACPVSLALIAVWDITRE